MVEVQFCGEIRRSGNLIRPWPSRKKLSTLQS